MGNPKVLLMDEPTEGLAPVVVEQLVAALRGVTADSSLAVLLVEQRVDVVLEMSSRCLIMDRGRVIHEEASALLREHPGRLARLIGLE
jgi:branched-chain amino acid transport system ATP-binding protein